MKNTTDKSKPPYRAGWYCIIPLVGFFVGLSLVLRGTFRYRDKKLILMGFGGMIFTVLVYGSMNYREVHDKEMWHELSFKIMEKIAKGLEKYKAQNGQYPDSLQQLKKYDFYIPINDPIQTSSQDHRPSLYNYRRIDDGYTLFSSGNDDIPNTSDDLYFSKKEIDSIKLLKQ